MFQECCISIAQKCCILLINIILDYPEQVCTSISGFQVRIIHRLWLSIDLDLNSVGNVDFVNCDLVNSLLASLVEVVYLLCENCFSSKGMLYLTENDSLFYCLLDSAHHLKKNKHQELIFSLMKSLFNFGDYLRTQGNFDSNIFVEMFADESLSNKLLDYLDNLGNTRSDILTSSIQQFIDEYFDIESCDI